MEKDRAIARLEQQNSRYLQEIDRRSGAETLAKTIIVAVQDFQQAKSHESSNPGDYSVNPPPTSDNTDSESLGVANTSIIQDYSQI